MQRTKAHGLLYKTLKKDSANSRVGSPDYLLVFRKRGDNPRPITHDPNDLPLEQWQRLASPVWMDIDQGNVLNGKHDGDPEDERHICPLQLDVIKNALTLWSARGDVVLSPFAGIGSEGYAALEMGRKFIGSELKKSYFESACGFLESAVAQAQDLFARPLTEPEKAEIEERLVEHNKREVAELEVRLQEAKLRAKSEGKRPAEINLFA